MTMPRTVAEASKLIAARELSPVELTRALVDRIAAIDPVISSYLTVTADHALAQAQAAEAEIARGYRGALHGIALGEPGYYVVEIENAPYARTSAVVTNLAVHVKRGGRNALVWVTRLDTGMPVADAQVAATHAPVQAAGARAHEGLAGRVHVV